MRNALILSLGLAVLSACKTDVRTLPESEMILARIDSIEAVLFADEEATVDTKAGMDLIREYARYYQANSADSLGIDMLFKAGEVSMGIGQGNLALKYFRLIAEDHSDFAKAPEAMFLCGFVAENINADTAQARTYYQAFVDAYPNHSLSKDASFSLTNLGKSDEELIRMFEQNLNGSE
jgi:hypothetical protein